MHETERREWELGLQQSKADGKKKMKKRMSIYIS